MCGQINAAVERLLESPAHRAVTTNCRSSVPLVTASTRRPVGV